jgi:hypothetical protein
MLEYQILLLMDRKTIRGNKNKARFKYYYLLSFKKYFFSKEQNVLLLNSLNKTYINNKKEYFVFSENFICIFFSVLSFFIIRFSRDDIKSIKIKNR